MMLGRMVFGVVIGIVEFSWAPIDAKLFLAFAVSQLVETHVHCFGAFWHHFSVDDAICHRVVGLQGGGRLLVSHLFQYDAHIHGLPGHYVKRRQFSLCGRGHDMSNDVCNVEDSAIVRGQGCIRGHEKVTTSLAASLWFAQIAGVAVGCQNHVAGILCDDRFVL